MNIKQSETVVIQRSEINFAPYNPKKHTKESIAAQKANFKRVGFLGGIVWNSLTGNLISGHKRVMAFDSINKYDGTLETDYEIKVEKIEVDEVTEKEQNIFMDASGTNTIQDYDLLKNLIPEINYLNAGLTSEDLNIIGISNTEIEELTNETSKDLNDVFKSQNEKKEAIKKLKKEIRQGIDERFGEGDTLVMLSFTTYKNKADFMNRFGYNQDDKFINGEEFAKSIEKI